MSHGTASLRSKPEPIESLEDIVVNATRIERYIDGLDRAAFTADEMIRDARFEVPKLAADARLALARLQHGLGASP